MKNLLKNTLKCLCCIMDNEEIIANDPKLTPAVNNKKPPASENNNSKSLTMLINENDCEGTATVTKTEDNNESNSQITVIGRDVITPKIFIAND